MLRPCGDNDLASVKSQVQPAHTRTGSERERERRKGEKSGKRERGERRKEREKDRYWKERR